MSKALTNRNPTSTTNILLFIAAIVIIYFVVKNKSMGQYLNEEKWEIGRDDKGFLTSIIVHRDAKQG